MKKMFEPLRVGTVEVKNRFVVPAMVTNYAEMDGQANEKFIAYHEEKAKGGWGLVIIENYAVMEKAGGFKALPGLWHDGQIKSHSILTERVKQHGAKIFAQIYHAGRSTSSAVTGEQCVAPSPYPDPVIGETPKELTREMISEIVKCFGDAALRAKKAGFDGIELHGAHGYLLDQFMSPFSNKRTDIYGGTIQNRARFALEVITNVKEKVGEDFPISYRISVDEFVEGGLTKEDNMVIAMMLEKAGVHMIHCSNGVYASMLERTIPPAAIHHAWSSDLTAAIKSVVTIPVVTVGRINDPLIAESVLVSGKADLVAMGRASLADPYLPNKAKDGEFDDIIHCIGCMQGCIGKNMCGLPVQCLVNPRTGKETEINLETSSDKKKVAIVGGGIAGMEAAITAGMRGHKVHLYERSHQLGGQWLLAAVPPAKEELNTFTRWQIKQLDKLGVNIHLNTSFTEDTLEAHKPDAVIIASGAEAIIPKIPGFQHEHVLTANEVLAGHEAIGANVVVVGGGLVGAETAAHLANHGVQVTLVEMTEDIAKDTQPGVRLFLMRDIDKHGVKVLTNTAVKEINLDSVVIENSDHELSTLENINNVVLAIGSKPNNVLAEQLSDKVESLEVIGDALQVRKALEAIEEGFMKGLSI